MTKLGLPLCLSLILIGSFCLAMDPETKLCMRAEERTAHLIKSKNPWEDFYAFYKEFAKTCDDGGVSEGISDSVSKILASWRDIPKLAEYQKKDAAFFKFIIKHIDTTALDTDIKQIEKNAKSKCPKGNASTCLEIASAIQRVNLEQAARPQKFNAFVSILEFSGSTNKDQTTRSVRAAFKKTNQNWESLKDKTIDIKSWIITFDGHGRGEVRTANQENKLYSDAGLLKVLNPTFDLPPVGKASSDFGTWSSDSNFRPLVLVNSEKSFEGDPEEWKPSKLTKDVEAAVRKQFRKNFPEVVNCKNINATAKPWKYTDKDLKIVKTYKNNNDLKIVGLDLGPYNCDGPPETAYSRAWYLIYRTGKIEYLDSGMNLVDAGDYDGDGRSELIFQVSRYNQGGYILYSDNLTNHTDFLFSYH